MPCLFCKSSTHKSRKCVDPNIIRTKNNILDDIDSKYYRLGKTTEFRDELTEYFNRLTMVEIKLIVVHYKEDLCYPIFPNDRFYVVFKHFPTVKRDMVVRLIDVIFIEIEHNLSINFFGPHTSASITRHTYIRPVVQIPIPVPVVQIPIPVPVVQIPRREGNVIVAKTYKPCKEAECPICLEEINDSNYLFMNCNHEFCKKCIKHLITHSVSVHKKCPLCRCAITKIYTQDKTMFFERPNLVL
jgi:hypothetical protein